MISSSTFRMRLGCQRGFGFIAMVFTLMGLAVLSAAIFLAFPPSESERGVRVTMQRADVLQAAIRKYKAQNATTAPNVLTDLVNTTGVPCAPDTSPSSSTYRSLKGWCGPYVDQMFTGTADEYLYDGWGLLF